MTLSETEIRILPDHIANQIAAGEVVQRPESIIKELVENSLDAGADTIAVVVRGAGKNFIHIIDNGKGMGKDDLLLAPKRHATSKIKTSEDLQRITTLGFRGEALASICAVAQVELRSRRRTITADRDNEATNEAPDETIGWKLLSEPLREPVLEPCAMDAGTQVFVRNLFFNVPARRKFLRSDLTEFRHISDTMTRFALGHPNVRFVFYDDDALIYDLQPADLKHRIEDVLSSRFADAILPVYYTDAINNSAITITGFIGQPIFAKKSKTEQFLYLNGRTITSRQLSHAIMSAYEHLIDHSSYPPFVLFITMDVERVDVNVHPQKHEVKFDDDRSIYSALRRAVSEALSQSNLTPQAEFRQMAESPFEKFRLTPNTSNNESFTQANTDDTVLVNRLTGEILDPASHTGMNERSYDRSPYQGSESYRADPQQRRMSNREVSAYQALFGEDKNDAFANASNARQSSYATPTTAPIHQSDNFASQQVVSPPRFLWQLHKKYIMMQTSKGLVVVDQHAAHERILYERALKAMNEDFKYGQELLFPVHITLTPSEVTLVQELRDDLTMLGFQLVLDGQNVAISGVPADVRNGHEEEALRELLEQYHEYQELRHTNTRDNLAASFGCRSAIRTGDALSIQEMRQLVDDLYATSMPYACPHGRPIIIEFPLEEFDRRFGRTS